ncbi:MAG TPA: pyridoxamine 5'-phosphate oxidase family protein [Ktedonobacterales bacterium]|jgi:hypothetical protein|nr:pyridoxamine 5'-phosphate oxidase family protein [Ktedonobacterales bacterium]
MGILSEDMKRLIASEYGTCFVATVSPDGRPNLSPKGTLEVLDDDHLVFCDIRSPNTRRNLEANPFIEINVVDLLSRKGYRFKGRAQVIREGDLYQSIIRRLNAGAVDPPPAHLVRNPEVPEGAYWVKSIISVTVEWAAAITAPIYDHGYDEETVRARWLARRAQQEASRGKA